MKGDLIIVRWMTLLIAVCLTLVNSGSSIASENCSDCHLTVVDGAHSALSCLDCHVSESATVADPAVFAGSQSPCVRCHKKYGGLSNHAMAVRGDEKAFVSRSYGRVDSGFYEKNCTGCHIKSCLDCHGSSGHSIAKPAIESCLSCHKGYYTGWDYTGRAPREDSLRYQRGKISNGEHYLAMRPDVHFEKGMTCGDCHSMASISQGKRSSKVCKDCHRISSGPVEHRIKAHIEKLECYACHSAWAPQEYGTFFLRFAESPSREDFWVRGSEAPGEYLRSAYLKKQDEPPLGLNSKGLVSPVRPQFIAYYTHIRRDKVVGRENRLLVAEWKAYFPHTIRRGTLLCDACHDAPARFLLEPPQNRIYRTGEDGMTLESFFVQNSQKVANGSFMPEERFRRLSARSPAFQKGYLEKWQLLYNRVEGSSLH